VEQYIQEMKTTSHVITFYDRDTPNGTDRYRISKTKCALCLSGLYNFNPIIIQSYLVGWTRWYRVFDLFKYWNFYSKF